MVDRNMEGGERAVDLFVTNVFVSREFLTRRLGDRKMAGGNPPLDLFATHLFVISSSCQRTVAYSRPDRQGGGAGVVDAGRKDAAHE
jgi:hypothetical protein